MNTFINHYRSGLMIVGLVLADMLALDLSVGIGMLIRFYYAIFPRFHWHPVFTAALIYLGLMHLFLFPLLAVSGGYQTPRRWGRNEVTPAALRTMGLLVPMVTMAIFLLRVGVTWRGALIPLSRIVMVLSWVGLYFGLIIVRLAAGRIQRTLFRRGVGLQRCLIFGDDESAALVAQRIADNPWLGERIVGRVGWKAAASLGSPYELKQLVHSHRIDCIWLALPEQTNLEGWLPDFFFSPQGSRVRWRILPEHFRNVTAANTANLEYHHLELLYARLQHNVSLPTLRIAMLGSRGVPASYSGVETYIEEVGSYLTKHGAQVTVYCHAKYVALRGSYRGMDLRFIPTIPSKHLETFIHTLLATLYALFYDAEVFHYHALGPSAMAWLPRLFGRKVVVTVQGLDWDRAKWGRLARAYLKFGEWCSAHFPHVTIVVSENLAKYYQQQYGFEPVYIPNGRITSHPLAPNLIRRLELDKDGYILFVGRLVPEKGIHTLLEAFARLHTDKKLIVAGEDKYMPEYRRRLQELASRSDQVNLLGFVRGELLGELYSNAYLFVLPSMLEGLSIALLEAMSYGNCVLVSDQPENLEVIDQSGYSFHTGDPTDLQSQLQWLVDHPDRVETMRLQARARLETLMDWQEVAQATLGVYRQLV